MVSNLDFKEVGRGLYFISLVLGYVFLVIIFLNGFSISEGTLGTLELSRYVFGLAGGLKGSSLPQALVSNVHDVAFNLSSWAFSLRAGGRWM